MEGSPAIDVLPKDRIDPAWVEEFLKSHNSDRIASRGRLHFPQGLPGFVARVQGRPIALVTYRLEDGECEITTLHSDLEDHGAGRALIEKVAAVARDAGCRRLWLVTTNDNTHAIRFYQRRGFTIAAVYTGAVTEARRALKPEIPLLGNDGIPIRDEIEFEIAPL